MADARNKKAVSAWVASASGGQILTDPSTGTVWHLATRPIAEGAFGVVVEATDRATGHKGAAKIEVDQPFSTLGRERIALMTLKGVPGIPAVLGAGNKVPIGGNKHVNWIITEWIGGGTLRDNLKRAQANPFELYSQLNETLTGVHAKNWVYVDLKPENILYSPERARWMLVDFGSAMPPIQLNKYVFNGTPAFASVRSLAKGGSQFSDDVESLLFIVEWVLEGGTLPWLSAGTATPKEAVARTVALPALILSGPLQTAQTLAPKPSPGDLATLLAQVSSVLQSRRLPQWVDTAASVSPRAASPVRGRSPVRAFEPTRARSPSPPKKKAVRARSPSPVRPAPPPKKKAAPARKTAPPAPSAGRPRRRAASQALDEISTYYKPKR